MLTTTAAARERLGLPDTKDDAWLTNAIGWATGMFEKFCNRQFGRIAGALQEFDAGSVANNTICADDSDTEQTP